MVDGYEWFRSVEWIWCLWLASVATLAWLTVRSVRYIRQRMKHGHGSWRRLWHSEEGGVYTLSYVMTFPFYLLLIALALECSLLIVAKIGSVYAAYAAARSAAVWESAGTTSTMTNKMHQAAALAMTPFSSGAARHVISQGSRPTARQVNALLKGYKEYRGSGDAYGDEYLARKCRYAWAATQVSLTKPQSDGKAIEVTLRYRAALHIPGIARLLGTRATDGNFSYYSIESRAIVQSETPLSRKTGINYP